MGWIGQQRCVFDITAMRNFHRKIWIVFVSIDGIEINRLKEGGPSTVTISKEKRGRQPSFTTVNSPSFV